MRISDWSSDVCSSDLAGQLGGIACTERAPAGDVRDAFEGGFIHAVAAAGHRHAEAEHGHVAAFAAERDGVHAHAVAARQLRGLGRVELAGVADAVGEQDQYALAGRLHAPTRRTEEHTSELPSLMRTSDA